MRIYPIHSPIYHIHSSTLDCGYHCSNDPLQMATTLNLQKPYHGFDQHDHNIILRHKQHLSIRNELQLHSGNCINSSLTTTNLPKQISLHKSKANGAEEGTIKETEGLISQVNSNTYATLLQFCANNKSLAGIKQLHAFIIKNGVDNITFLGAKLVSMYCKCGNVGDARLVFNKMPNRDLFLWAAMMAGYTSQGLFEDTIAFVCETQCTGLKPNSYVIPSVLKACANLEALQWGKEVHVYVIRNGYDSDVVVVNALIDMYSKCRRIEDARKVFEKMSQRDVISWNSMISCYMQNGYGKEALGLLEKMQVSGISPDVGSWNAMIVGYVRNGHDAGALELFRQMQLADRKPNSFTVTSVLPACGNLVGLEQGKQIHGYVIRSGIELNVFMGSALVDMYANCGTIIAARRVFDRMSERNEVLWNAMIAGYAQNGHADEALELFRQMHLAGLNPDVVTWNRMIARSTQSGCNDDALKLFQQMLFADVKPDSFTFGSIVTACAALVALEHGKEVHSCIIKCGLQSDVFVGSALVDMYVKFGHVVDAHQVFERICQRNAVSWNALIMGYGQSGQVDEALNLFCQMEGAGLMPDVISWNSLIVSYTQNGNGVEALKIFHQMQVAGCKPNSFTFVSVLPACTSLVALEQGKEIHACIIRTEIESDVFVGSVLVDMYAKCGNIKNAEDVFGKILQKNLVSWNAMISGYAMHGYGKVALSLFDQMLEAGLKPDHITFTGVLSACSHAGLVVEGWNYFHSMSQDFYLTPGVEHYACIVDLLGRAGELDKAQQFINDMPLEPNAHVWGALLGACRIHCNVELGKSVAERLFVLEPENTGNYVLLSNIYASTGRWDDVEEVRKMMKERGLRKIPGCSCIRVNKREHKFFVRGKQHPQKKEIDAMLEILDRQMKDEGYIPDTRFALRHVDKEEKGSILCGHSERQAIAFGILNTHPGTPLRIIKNLRVCGDCHSAAKYISKIVNREIFMRDSNRFHHFRDGFCSCGDYW